MTHFQNHLKYEKKGPFFFFSVLNASRLNATLINFYFLFFNNNKKKCSANAVSCAPIHNFQYSVSRGWWVGRENRAARVSLNADVIRQIKQRGSNIISTNTRPNTLN